METHIEFLKDLIPAACGVDLGYESFPYVYFVTPQPDYLYRTLCLSQCPAVQQGINSTQILMCRPNQLITNCSQNPSIFNLSTQVMIYDTFTYKDNICIPTELYYYNSILSEANPPTIHQTVHDLFYTRWVVIFLGPLLSVCLTIMMVRFIDTNYALITWIFLVGTVICFGLAGMMFSINTMKAYNALYNLQPAVNEIKVSAAYILEVSDNPNFILNLILAIVFVLLFIFCSYQLHLKYDDVGVLIRILKLTEQFMEEPKNRRLKQFASLLFVFLSVVLALNYFILIYLFSCIQINGNPLLGPFKQAEPTLIQQIFIPIIIFIIVLQNNLYVSCVEYVTIASINKWFRALVCSQMVGSQKTYMQSPPDSRIYSVYGIYQASDIKNLVFCEDHVKIAVEELFSRMGKIAKYSLTSIILTIPKLFVDYIMDSIKSIKEPIKRQLILNNFLIRKLNQIYEQDLRAVEPVIYVEICNKNCSVREAMEYVLVTLNSDPDNQDEYEKYSMMGNLFNTISRGFIVIFVFVLSKLLFDQYPTFANLLYTSINPSIICAIYAYFICSLYLSIYGLAGSTFLYLMFQTRNELKASQASFRSFMERLGEIFPSMFEFYEFAQQRKSAQINK